MKKTPPVLKERFLNGRRFRILLWCAVLLALALRMGAAWEIAHGSFAASIFHPAKVTDLATYMDLSQKIASGSFTGPFYYQPFYYAVFLPVCRWLSGGSVWMVVFVQALLGSFAAYFAGLAAARAGGKIAGLLAAYLTAICSILIFYTPFHQIATLQSFWMALLAYFAVHTAQEKRLGLVAATGAVAACGALTRGNVLLVFVPLLLVLAFAFRGWKKRIGALTLGAAVYLVVQSPFIVYNSIQLGRLSGPSTAADAVLALGNTPEAPPGGRDPGLPAGPMEYPEAYQVWMETAPHYPVIRRIGEYFCAEPAAYLELTFRKLLLFWDHREIPNNVALAGEGSTSAIIGWTLPPGVILALGVAGLLLAYPQYKRKKIAWMSLAVIALFYWGATAAFYNLSRFRAPVLPVLAAFAGFAVTEIARRYHLKDWRFLRLPALVSVALGAFLTFGAYEFYRNYYEAMVMRIVRPNGTRLKLNDGRMVQFYHGPMSFGGWRAIDVAKNARLEIGLPHVVQPAKNKVTVKFKVVSDHGGVLAFLVNSIPVESTIRESGVHSVEAELPATAAGEKLTLRMLRNTAEAKFLVDVQRDYGASSLDGKPLPGEVVMRVVR